MKNRERILEWLREADAPVSGAELASRLGCTRAAVWKHVAALRASGHEIRGRRASGYVLERSVEPIDAPTIARRLVGSWRQVEWHDTIDSTQHRARELADAGAPEGSVVLADRQTAGRGRLGRTWFSPPGVNVMGTVLLRPACDPSGVAPLPLVVGLAVADAIHGATGIRPGLKWPNDVQIGGRKVAGVLTELQGQIDRVEAVLVGIGINVNLAAEALPPDLAEIATSLRIEIGRPVDRIEVVARLLAALEARYGRFLVEGFRGMRAEWEAASVLKGHDVQVVGGGASVTGRVHGIDDGGALLVAEPGGRVRRVLAGEVTLRREVRA